MDLSRESDLLVSIIIPTFNRAKSIAATIQSVRNQLYTNWEIIVVDDGSEDETESMVKSLSAKNTRIRYYKRKEVPKGGNHCRNIGIDKAKGAYFIFLDSDDLLLPFCLEQRCKEIGKFRDLDFLGFPGAVFDKDPLKPTFYWNVETADADLRRFLAFDSPWQTSGAIWKKSSLDRVELLWDERMHIWQDIDFHARALLIGLKYKIFWEQPFDYLVRSGSEDSLSRMAYFTPQKNESRNYFWNKCLTLKEVYGLKAEWLRPLFLSVLNSALKAGKRDQQSAILNSALENEIIGKKEYSLLKRNLWASRLTSNRITFPTQRIASRINPYVLKLQQVHV